MNVMIAQKLPEMFSLARDRSDTGRMRLANLLAEVFLENSSLSDREQILLNEVIDELIGNATPQVREMLAQRLSSGGNVPHRVLLSLACDDEVSVAMPILKNAPLKDDDLIFVVEAHGRDHALAIAERVAVSEAVVDALVSTGDVEVMTLVAENLGATISARAMHVLLETARFGEKLQHSLVKRPELTADMGVQLYWWLETELRRTVVKRFGITSGQVEEALERSIADLLKSVEADRNDALAMHKVAEWFQSRDAMKPRVMIQCLRMGFFKLFETMMAIKTGIDSTTISVMIAEDGGKTFAVLCRSLGVDKPSFVSLFLLSRGARPGEQIVNPKELSIAIGAFDRIDYATAKKVVESWQHDPSYLQNRLHAQSVQ